MISATENRITMNHLILAKLVYNWFICWMGFMVMVTIVTWGCKMLPTTSLGDTTLHDFLMAQAGSNFPSPTLGK
jgi:hypothetical protein